ncbi:hypothetical protein EDD76_102272 [Kineothrix alysoides]|uniref:Uncharacterized protein n=1 Tax=Kineothrix alysoides TaxID=1469948 RepID=A0A4R1R503_9FIRM|nr:hypothetical protein [Kineothrix alysoides]TCL60574.1 hypothetical protein EDD76_102272 [Kineothrix alysoides]
MTRENVPTMLKEMSLSFAYDHYAEGEAVNPPFLVYRYPRADNFAADGVAYFKQDVFHLELYTDIKDPEIEARVEAVLDKYNFFYEKSETWISTEKMYEVLYEMEV